MEPPRKKTKKTQKTRTLLELPTDVFLLIVDRLCSEDLLACRLVHSQVNQIVCCDQVWRPRARRLADARLEGIESAADPSSTALGGWLRAYWGAKKEIRLRHDIECFYFGSVRPEQYKATCFAKTAAERYIGGEVEDVARTIAMLNGLLPVLDLPIGRYIWSNGGGGGPNAPAIKLRPFPSGIAAQRWDGQEEDDGFNEFYRGWQRSSVETLERMLSTLGCVNNRARGAIGPRRDSYRQSISRFIDLVKAWARVGDTAKGQEEEDSTMLECWFGVHAMPPEFNPGLDRDE